MGVSSLRPLASAHVPTALDSEFDEDVGQEELMGMVGVARGRSRGSDEQFSAGEVIDVLFDPVPE